MKTRKTLVSVMVASGLLVGCGDDISSWGDNSSGSGTYTLSVTVVDEVTNNKIEGADVIIDGKTVSTNSDGLAEFELASGTYGVEVDEAVGYFNEYASVTITDDQSVTYELEEYDESAADGATAAIAASSVGSDLSFAYQWETWDSGTVIGNSSDAYYTDVITLTSGTGWGDDNAVLAFGNDSIASINIEEFSHLAIKVDPSSFTGSSLSESMATQAITATGGIEVEIQSASSDPQIITAEFTSGSELDGNWIQLLVALPDVQDMTWIATKFAGAGTVKVTDIYLSELRDGTPAEDDGGDDAEEPSESTTNIYSSSTGAAAGITFAEPGWGSGSSPTALDKTDEGNYDHVIEWAMGGGWGGEGVESGFAAAVSIDGLSDISASTYLNVKFKYTDTNSATAGWLEIQMPDYTTQTVYETASEWSVLSNGWIQVSVPTSGFEIPEGDNPTQIVLIVKDDASNPVYFTDINISDVSDLETEGTDTDGSGTDTDGSGTDTDGSGTDTDGSGTDTDGSGTDTDGSGTDTDGSGTDTDGSGTDTDGSGTDTDGSGTDTDGSGTDTDDSGSVEAATIYSSSTGSVDGVTFSEPGWGSGSSITTLDKTDEGNYDHVMEWAMGSGWGGAGVENGFAVANSITGLSNITDYTSFNVKFKYTDTDSASAGFIEIQMPGYATQLIYETSTEWTALSNGWIQVSVPVSAFAIPEGDDPEQIVLIVKDSAENPVYFTDITFE